MYNVLVNVWHWHCSAALQRLFEREQFSPSREWLPLPAFQAFFWVQQEFKAFVNITEARQCHLQQGNGTFGVQESLVSKNRNPSVPSVHPSGYTYCYIHSRYKIKHMLNYVIFNMYIYNICVNICVYVEVRVSLWSPHGASLWAPN